MKVKRRKKDGAMKCEACGYWVVDHEWKAHKKRVIHHICVFERWLDRNFDRLLHKHDRADKR